MSSSEYDITPKMTRREEALESSDINDYYRPPEHRKNRAEWSSDDRHMISHYDRSDRRYSHPSSSASRDAGYANRQRRDKRSRSPSGRMERISRRHSESSSSVHRDGQSSRSRHHPRSRSRPRSRNLHREDDTDHRPRRKHRHDTSPSEDSDSSYQRRKRREEREKRRETERAERKRHKSRKEDAQGVSQSRSQISWGKYGLVDSSDMAKKAQEFRAWLVEERGLNPDWITRDRSKKEFKVYIEDYNTGTLSHEKYYDMEKYRFNMEIIKSGHTLPIDEGSYDPTADLKAHNRRVKAEKRKEHVLSREDIEELRQVEKERVEMGRMKLLGIDVPREMGVRVEWQTVDAVNYNENKPW